MNERNEIIDPKVAKRLLRHPQVIKAELSRWERTARAKQLPPPGEWRIWALQTGRGWGKTRTAAEFIRCEGVLKGVPDILAVGPTATDVHDVMAPMLMKVLERYKPTYLRSIEAPCIQAGSTKIHLRSGQRIDRCRGLEVGMVWADEVDHWKPEMMKPREAWLAVVEPTCRKPPARFVVTSTPRRSGMMHWLSTRTDVALTRGHSNENVKHLSAGFVEGLSAAYAGSWLERQELGGEIVLELDGAIVTHAMIEETRVSSTPELVRVVVGVDPSGGLEAQGIIICAKSTANHIYVLADCTCTLGPDGWGRRVVEAFDAWEADRVVAEANYGGQMVESTLRTVRRDLPIKMVTASRGKHVRFEPVGALYEQGRIHHVGSMPELEDEITSFTPMGYEGAGSPNRADALVWSCSELIGRTGVHPADLYGGQLFESS